jgi:hypothetical protein
MIVIIENCGHFLRNHEESSNRFKRMLDVLENQRKSKNIPVSIDM